MKTKVITSFIILIISLSFLNVFAETKLKATGIGIRGSFWNISKHSTYVRVTAEGEQANVHIAGVGGWVYLFTRLNNTVFLEMSLGAIGSVEGETTSDDNDNVDVTAIVPLLIGLRYNLLSPMNQSSVEPYVTFGAGPYWFTKVKVREEHYDEEEVTVSNNIERGGYAGGGLNFKLSSWCAINFDVKYHFINFNVNHERSGYEYGIGINFMWGNYVSQQP